jgi:Flp pilus assembly protein TadD
VEVAAGSSIVGSSPFRVEDGKAQALSEAEAEAKKLKLQDPHNATSHVLLSILYTQNGLNEKAVEALNGAIAAQPEEEAFMGRMKTMMNDVNKKAEENTAYARNYYEAVDELWGTDTYFDPDAWRWDGWDF